MTATEIPGLVSRRPVAPEDIPVIINGTNRKPLGPSGTALLAFVQAGQVAELFEFDDIVKAQRFRHGAAAFIQGRRRKGPFPVRVISRGTAVYLIRADEGGRP